MTSSYSSSAEAPNETQRIARKIGVIGTAGRDNSHTMNRALWMAMLDDLGSRIAPEDTLVSGGAAWADHLAVQAYLNGWCSKLELYLPAPFVNGKFVGAFKSSGATANYYHSRFSQQAGLSSLVQLQEAIDRGALVSYESEFMMGYGAMFARNAKIAAASTKLLAYTFGAGPAPSSSGTLDTWRKFTGQDREHISLLALMERRRAAEADKLDTGEEPKRVKFYFPRPRG